MSERKNYSSHRKVFTDWCRDNGADSESPTWEDMEDFCKHVLHSTELTASGKKMKWYAAKDWYHSHSSEPPRKQHEMIAGIEYAFPLPRPKHRKSWKMSDSDFDRYLGFLSDRIKAFCLVARNTELSQNEILSLKPFDSRVDEQVMAFVQSVYGGARWAFETRDRKGELTGKSKNRTEIGLALNKAAARCFGKGSHVGFLNISARNLQDHTRKARY